MKPQIADHFDVMVLMFMFIFSCIMIAMFPTNEELGRLIETGALPMGILGYVTGRKVEQLMKATNGSPAVTVSTTDTKTEVAKQP